LRSSKKQDAGKRSILGRGEVNGGTAVEKYQGGDAAEIEADISPVIEAEPETFSRTVVDDVDAGIEFDLGISQDGQPAAIDSRIECLVLVED
jgi:hypothetical protein